MAWTETTRRKYQRDGLCYASDTTDLEWTVIEPHLPPPASCGRARTTRLREVVDAIFYVAQSGCQWRMLPKCLPPFTTVQRYFYAWRDNGTWQAINHVLLMAVREAAGREASPTDFEATAESAVTWLYIASVKLMSRRPRRHLSHMQEAAPKKIKPLKNAEAIRVRLLNRAAKILTVPRTPPLEGGRDKSQSLRWLVLKPRPHADCHGYWLM